VLAVLRLEGGPQVGVHEQPMALHTEAERTDEAVLAGLRDQVRTRHARAQAEGKIRDEESRFVHQFVMAQPHPATFALRMREAGTPSLRHAWLAITLAAGNPDRAVKLARDRTVNLYALLKRLPAE
jgi:hypothetical protein